MVRRGDCEGGINNFNFRIGIVFSPNDILAVSKIYLVLLIVCAIFTVELKLKLYILIY